MGASGQGRNGTRRARTGATAFALAYPTSVLAASPTLACLALIFWIVCWQALSGLPIGAFGLSLVTFGTVSMVLGLNAATDSTGMLVISAVLGAVTGLYAFGRGPEAAR